MIRSTNYIGDQIVRSFLQSSKNREGMLKTSHTLPVFSRVS